MKKTIILIVVLFATLTINAQETIIDSTKANGQRVILTWDGNCNWHVVDSSGYMSYLNTYATYRLEKTRYVNEDTISSSFIVAVMFTELNSKIGSNYTRQRIINKIKKASKHYMFSKLKE